MFMSNPLYAIQNVVPGYYPPIGGQGFATTLDSIQYVYLPILKNAHSWTYRFLVDNLGIELEENNCLANVSKISSCKSSSIISPICTEPPSN